MGNMENRENVIIDNCGQKIFGVIHRPLTEVKYPALLMCHGLGGNKIGKQRLFVVLAQRLAALGIASLRIDFRGSGDSEGEFSEMTIDGEVSDAVCALNYLKNDPNIDYNRISIFGRSFGGIVAMLAASHHDRIRSLALWAPVFNGNQWREQWQLLHSQAVNPERRDALMSFEGMRPSYKFFEQFFALKIDHEAAHLKSLPMLHIHGAKDLIVDLSHAKQFEAMRQHAAETKFLILPNSDHDFTDQGEREIALEETIKWFRKTLS
jgi:dipeptidyl aminopeptidase/acylaminoacyl peptidase